MSASGDWSCDESLNSPASQAMCLCWEQLQEEFHAAALHEFDQPSSYHEECISEVNNLYVPVIIE